MKHSVKTLAAAALTLVLVAASLLIPGELMAKEDRKSNGIVQASDKVYYTGVLDTYLGDESFYNRLMLMTGKWESKSEKLNAQIFPAEIEGVSSGKKGQVADTLIWQEIGFEPMDYISRLALLYWEADGTENRVDSFLYQGNAIRAMCNLTAFELMPELFSPYYRDWSVLDTEVYRYTDSYFGKYKCDMALICFEKYGAEGRLLVDVESGDYTGFWLRYYDAEYLAMLKDELTISREEGKEEMSWQEDWLALFIDGETAALEDGTSVKNPLSETREEKLRMNENVSLFMEKIGFGQVAPVADPAEIREIPEIPLFKNVYESFIYGSPNTGNELTYAYSVTEESTQKKFYFVISSGEGSFVAYFSPMPEKTTENNLTDR